MKAEGGDHSMINLSVQQVLSLWAHGTVLRNLTEMWYWIFLWALFSSLFVHGAAGVLMFVMLQRHRQGRVISLIAVSIGFLASVTGAMITRSSPRSEPRGQGLLHRRRRCTDARKAAWSGPGRREARPRAACGDRPLLSAAAPPPAPYVPRPGPAPPGDPGRGDPGPDRVGAASCPRTRCCALSSRSAASG
ncbi:transmembrane protein 170B isoform X1 [Canis lupus baileyi]|uniref:transmembrane protein 170B isoform X1 n=1 Tax=Canis lupus baileyi TaxID=143281 RepID=UPI003B979240